MQLADLASAASARAAPAALEETAETVVMPAAEYQLLSAPQEMELPFRPVSMSMWVAKEALLAMAAWEEAAAAAPASAAMLLH